MDVNTILERIICDATPVIVPNIYGAPQILLLKSLSLQSKHLVDVLYKNALKEARALNCLGAIELSMEYQKRAVWTEAEETQITSLEGRLLEIQDELNGQSPRYRKVLEKSFESTEESLRRLQNRRAELFSRSVEKYAEGIRTGAIVYSCTYKENGTRYWSSYEDFQAEQDTVLIHNIVEELNGLTRPTPIEIRAAARSNYWRIQWNAAKDIGDLFGCPIVELTPEQHLLIYWSSMYDGVYEHPERPDDAIIENDEALDAWFKEQGRKKQVESLVEGKKGGSVKVSQRVSRHGEVFVVANPLINPEAPSISDIANLNDGLTRKLKEAELAKLKQHGELRETELRDRKNKIARKLIGSSDAVIKKSGLGGHSRGGRNAGEKYPGGTIG